MELPDSRRFVDVAGLFKIAHASIVEKDYLSIEIITEVSMEKEENGPKMRWRS